MKICSKCNTERSYDDFTKDKTKKDGLCCSCKICHKDYRSKNKERNIASVQKWRKENPPTDEYRKRANEKQRVWYLENKENRIKRIIIWKKDNKGKCNFYVNQYRLNKQHATPSWLSVEQLKEIEDFYLTASDCNWLSNGGLHVDHIVPLRGKNVCGLHVPWNLQILPASQNCSKNNKYEF